jgi:hypothetical protein
MYGISGSNHMLNLSKKLKFIHQNKLNGNLPCLIHKFS